MDVLVRAVAALNGKGEDLRLRIIGDGPVRGDLERLTLSIGVTDRVRLEGAMSQSRVLDFYEQAHVLVLASQTEGWPKAIAEGMAFGLVCIGTNRGLVPQMLGEGRGLIVEPGDVASLAETLQRTLNEPEKALQMSEQAAVWASQFTLEGLREALLRQLLSSWRISPDVFPQPPLKPSPVVK